MINVMQGVIDSVFFSSDPQAAAERSRATAPAGRGGAAAADRRQGAAAQPQHHPGGNSAAQPAAGSVHSEQTGRHARRLQLLQRPRQPAVLAGVRGGAKDDGGQCLSSCHLPFESRSASFFFPLLD